MLAPLTLDFETQAIAPRPDYPPAPVGLAVWEPGAKPRYIGWGHPESDPRRYQEADQTLRRAWASGRPLLFHHAKFDLAVAQEHFGLPPLPWERVHDTLFLLFLDQPHADSLSLKPSAERVLGLPPEEQDAVRQWLIGQKIVTKTQKDWGAYIARAPEEVVGPYAVGDVVRTRKLFDTLHTRVLRGGMGAAYDRERRLLPILMEQESRGVRVRSDALHRAAGRSRAALRRADGWLQRALRTPSLNVDADREVGAALERADAITRWTLTPTGQKSVSKVNLHPSVFRDPALASVLGYRQRLRTCLSTFLEPWCAMSDRTGRIYTSWNQVRQSHGFDSFQGARTGRLSSTPNFQNIPTIFEGRDDGFVQPEGFPPLPLMRTFLVPETGETWWCRDYNQQELRILAHYEDDVLARAYHANVRLDMHTFIQQEILRVTGLAFDRKHVKNFNFAMLYGAGVKKISEMLRVSPDEARSLFQAHVRALPGLAALKDDLVRNARNGQPVTTWGGRVYYPEPSRFVDGELRTYEYRVLNTLIQGSAADCTKEALIRYHGLHNGGTFLVTVHDEINVSAARGSGETERLQEAMESIVMDIPMVTDGKSGRTWGAIR